MLSLILFRFSKPNSCLVLLFFLSSFHQLFCVTSQREHTLCDNLFHCGNITTGFPFWGDSRPEACGHPSLVLHCHKNTTNLIISGQMYQILQIDNSSNTLRLARQDFLGQALCDATFTGTTLTPELFELLPDYKILFVYYLCNHRFHNPANFSCPKLGVASVDQNSESNENCGASFNITVPVSYDPEGEAFNVTHLESALKEGFKVKLKIEKIPCQECQNNGGICAYNKANPICCKTNSSSETNCTPMTPFGSNGRSKKVKIGIGFACGFIGASLIVVLCFIIWRRNKLAAQHRSKGLSTTALYSSTTMSMTPTSTTISNSNHSLVPSMSSLANGSVYFGVQVFSYEELEEATQNFSRELGDGGFGTVYYGVLKDGRAVAVKRLFERSIKRVEQFKNEIEILKSLKHPNLVILYGCTTRHSRELLLVYEYISNGTLADHLHGDQAETRPICWPGRLKIAIETASALSFQVKVADFGLSRLFPTDQTHISTAPQGTPGYVDPEYYQCYRLNEKSDVYSFGVVLSELISSKEAVDITRHRHDINLANMAVAKIQNDAVHELADLSLGFAKDPSMDEIVEVLRGIQKAGIVDASEVVEIDVNGRDDVGLLNYGVPPPLSPATDKETTSSSNTTASSF